MLRPGKQLVDGSWTALLLQCRSFAAAAEPKGGQPSTASASSSTSSTSPSSRLVGGRYGSRLLRAGRTAEFRHMQRVLGCEEASTSRADVPDAKVTISILQTLKYLDLDPDANSKGVDFKWALARYRIAALGREMAPLLLKTNAFLGRTQASDREQPQPPIASTAASAAKTPADAGAAPAGASKQAQEASTAPNTNAGSPAVPVKKKNSRGPNPAT